MRKRTLGTFVVSMALAGLLVACGGTNASRSLSSGEEPGTYEVSAVNAGEDQVASSEFTIGEGELFIVSPMLEKGSIRVALSIAGTDEIMFEETVSGSVFYSYEVDPGSYILDISGVEGEDATGSVHILTMSAKELEEQEESLKESLEEVGMDPSVLEDGDK